MADESILKLGESIDKYAASALSNVSIPEFKGLPDEDVYEFLSRFKIATIMFTDDTRCLAIYKALSGSAHTWAKQNIKELVKAGKWKDIKKLLVARFSGLDHQLRHQKRLMKMKFDPTKSSLLSYIEEFACAYKKAYTDAKDSDIIKSLSLNLPPKIIRHLNILSDSWTDLDDLKDLYGVARRLEEKILPYELAEESKERASLSELTKMLKEMQETHKKILESHQTSKEVQVVEAVAAIGKVSPPKQPTDRQLPYPPKYNNNYRPGRGRYKSYYNNVDSHQSGHPTDQKRLLPSDPVDQTNKNDMSYKDLFAVYEAKYGKLPGPCYYCEGQHFNTHCPLRLK